MPRFAANLTMLYNEFAFLDRFAAAALDGFDAVEYLFPYAFPSAAIAEQLERHDLQQVLFNAPPGDWDRGERGIACLPGREEAFRRGIDSALDYAAALACPRVHVMAGLAPDGIDRRALRATYVANLAWAAARAASRNVDILIEPINPRDIPRFFLNRQDDAHAVVAEIGAANLKVQMDLYHCQVVEGDVTTKLRKYLPTGKVGHLQIAGVPERHEPSIGELDHDYLFSVIDELGFDGWVGCEYKPRAGTSDGLGWLRRAAGNPR